MMRLTSTLQRFYRERRGSVSMMVGLIVPALTTAVMASVEFNSVVVTKAKIQNQADSAALFAANNQDLLNPESGSDLQTATREHIVEAIAVSNLDVSNVQTKYTFDAARDRIVGEVTFTPNAKFLGSVFLPETVKIVTEAAPLRPKKVEISLVLDLSGSMNYSPTSDAETSADSFLRNAVVRETTGPVICSVPHRPDCGPLNVMFPESATRLCYRSQNRTFRKYLS